MKSANKNKKYAVVYNGKTINFGDSTAVWLKYNLVNKTISFDWSHLPFMQVFEKDRAEVNAKNATTLSTLISTGVTPESAAVTLNMEVEFNPERNEPQE